jgi:signal transduction histidine kinase
MIIAIPAVVAPLVINIVNGTENEFSMFLLILGIATVTSIEPNRWLSSGLVWFVGVTILVLSGVGVYDWDAINWLVALVLGAAFGIAVYNYDQVVAELRATQVELVDQAALHERRRIARDVHDLVGHSLSVVLLHVAGARRLVRSDPDEAETALLQAEEAGRASMSEVRRTIGLLRAGDDNEGSAPVPDLSDIIAVVDQYRAAGMNVELRVVGPVDDIEGPPALACHRIVQEALANVTKHTVGADVTVEVVVDSRQCQVTVRNLGGEVVSPVSGLADGVGHGLVGMRERALSVGGSLLAGPTGGGWSVEVTIPRAAGIQQ